MAYNVRKLITEAYYLTNIVSREFQTIEGSQLELGFSLFNDFLALESVSTQYVPYYQQHSFDTEVGKEKYHFDNLVDVEAIDFYLANVRIPVFKKSRREYFYSGRIEGFTVMPFTCRIERALKGTDIWIYPLSSIPYTVMMMAKFAPAQVETYDDDLEALYDRWYIVYMRYALAELICNHEGINVPQQISDKLDNIKAEIKDTSFPDMRCSVISTLGDEGTDFVGDIVKTVIGGGWVP